MSTALASALPTLHVLMSCLCAQLNAQFGLPPDVAIEDAFLPTLAAMSGRQMSEKEASEAAEYTQAQVEAATQAAREASEAFVEAERERAAELAQAQARLDEERAVAARAAAEEKARKQQEAAASRQKRAAERHEALSEKRKAGKKKQGLPLVTPPESDAEADKEAEEAQPQGDTGGGGDADVDNDPPPSSPITSSPPAVVHPAVTPEPAQHISGVGSAPAPGKQLPTSRPEDELAAFVANCKREGKMSRMQVLDGLLSHVPVLPEFGSPMLWPRLFELLDVPSFEYLVKLLECREPRKKTQRSYALVIVDAVRQHHYLEYQPLEHPTDVCGACERRMPWRPPNQPNAHNCDRCGKPLHGAGVPECSRIIVEETNFFCNETCQGVVPAAAPAPARGRRRKVGALAFEYCPSPICALPNVVVFCT